MSSFSTIEIDNTEFDGTAYNALLLEANNSDFADLERVGCVTSGLTQSQQRVIIFVPRLGLDLGQDKSDDILKRMMLLFIRIAHSIVNQNYTLIYAHTPMSIFTQQPVIYKYYKILPRSYKKNLQHLYVIHPQMGIKLFFEFARVFLSTKFYNKLNMIDSIAEFQERIPPTQLALPCKFLALEDDSRGLRFNGIIPSLDESFCPALGTTKLLYDGIKHLRKSGGFARVGLFRVSGDESQLTLAKIRMQKTITICNSKSSDNGGGGVMLPVVFEKIIIGVDEEGDEIASSSSLLTSEAEQTVGDAAGAAVQLSAAETTTSPSASSSTAAPADKRFSSMSMSQRFSRASMSSLSSSSSSSSSSCQLSTALFTDLDSVAQIIKFSLRSLPEPLITFDAFERLMALAPKHKFQSTAGPEWEDLVDDIISSLPAAHLSTFRHLVSFLAEMSTHSAVTCMDVSNLAKIFAPSLLRPRVDDPATVLQEITQSQVIMSHVISSALQQQQLQHDDNGLPSASARDARVSGGGGISSILCSSEVTASSSEGLALAAPVTDDIALKFNDRMMKRMSTDMSSRRRGAQPEDDSV